MTATTAYRRIETLIPYKELDFAPKAKIGKLNLSNSIWSICAKLGRYLLSGADQRNVDEIAREAAAWALGIDADEFELAEPDDDQANLLFWKLQSPCTTFAAPDGRFVVVSHGKASKNALGCHKWKKAGLVHIMKLPAALGMMELIDMVDGSMLPRLVREKEAMVYREAVKRWRAYFKELEAQGRVEYSPAGRGGRAFAVEYDVDGSVYSWYYDNMKLMILGTRDELDEEAAEQGERAVLNIDQDKELILKESGYGDCGGRLAGVLRDLAQKRWDEEACRELNRRFASDKEIAGVFADKKSCDEAHRAAAASGYLAERFRHVEVDDDVDLDAYRELVAEFEARDGAGELPQVNQASIALRFRKCGRHRAIGVYCPALLAVAVDPRAPRSLLHELAHAYDFERGQLSVSAAFAPVLRVFRDGFDSKGMSESKAGYYSTPTEVFARAWEVHAAMNGLGGSFVDTVEEYQEHPGYKPLIDAFDVIEEYFASWVSNRRKACDGRAA